MKPASGAYRASKQYGGNHHRGGGNAREGMRAALRNRAASVASVGGRRGIAHSCR